MICQKKIPDAGMIWFDLDQTLLDHLSASRAALVALKQMDERWSHVSEERWISTYRKINGRLWKDGLRTANLSMETVRVERFHLLLESLALPADETDWVPNTYLDLYVDRCTCYVGAREVVERLHTDGRRIGIITDGARDIQLRKIAHCQLDAFIETIVTPDDAGAYKPERAIFEYATRIAELPAYANVCVGDSWEHDIEGAIGAGWSAVWLSDSSDIVSDGSDVLPNDADVPTRGKPPDVHIIRRLDELEALL
jgi:5'-nucleotidase